VLKRQLKILANIKCYLAVDGLGEEKGSSKAIQRGWRMPSSLGEKSYGSFGQPVFFLAANCMTIVAFEKEVSLKCFFKFI